MFEGRNPPTERRSTHQRRGSFSSISSVGFGTNVNENAKIFGGLKRPRRRRYNTISVLGTFASVLAAIFLLYHCRIRNVEDTVSSVVTRKLSDGKRKVIEDSSPGRSEEVCGDFHGEALERHSQRADPAAPPLPAARAMATTPVERGSEQSMKKMKRWPFEDSEKMPVEPRREERIDEWKMYPLQRLQGGSPDEKALGTSSAFHSSFEWLSGQNKVDKEQFLVSRGAGGSSQMYSATMVSSINDRPASTSGRSYDFGSMDEKIPLRESTLETLDVNEPGGISPLSSTEKPLLSFFQASTQQDLRDTRNPSYSQRLSVIAHQIENPSTSNSATEARRDSTHKEKLQETTSQRALAENSSGDLASTVEQRTVQFLMVRVPDFKSHLYYHVPDVPQGLNLTPLNINFAQLKFEKKSLAAYLFPLRNLFIKPRLTSKEMQILVYETRKLLIFVENKLKRSISLKKPNRALVVLSTRFLVADYLFCACELAGAALKKHHWWDSLLLPLLEPLIYADLRFKRRNGSDSEEAPFARRLIAALKEYYAGQRPGPVQVITLKQDIFFSPRNSIFKDNEWGPWRADNTFIEPPEPALRIPMAPHQNAFPLMTEQALTEAASTSSAITGAQDIASSLSPHD